MKSNILAIDHGTQSVRGLIFDPQGNLLAKSQIHIEPYYSRQPGWAEQDPNVFWQALCEACQTLWSTCDIPKDSIASVALTTQRATMLNVDEHGNPLRPAIVWLDQRRTENLKPIGGLWGAGFRLMNARDTVAYLQAEAEANWLRTFQPDIWQNTHKYLFLSGFLVHHLVGRFVDSVGSQVGYIPFDYKALDWSKSWDWKWQAVPVEQRKLPELVPQGEILGEITAEASEATGIPQGLPLIAAAADKSCEVLGSGGIHPHIGCISYGTAATLNTTHKKYVEVVPLIPPYPAAAPQRYSLEFMISRGYWMVNWFKNEFALREQRLAEEQGIIPEELFDELVAKVPPGSEGLILQPYWSPPPSKTRKPAVQSSDSTMCIPVPTFTGRSLKGLPTRYEMALNAPRNAARSRLLNCAWRVAAARVTPPCRLPQMYLVCR